MNIKYDEIGERAVSARLAQGKSVALAAHEACMLTQSLAHLETKAGAAQWPLGRLAVLAEVLDVSPLWLVFGVGDGGGAGQEAEGK